jgi:hypothetical protein
MCWLLKIKLICLLLFRKLNIFWYIFPGFPTKLDLIYIIDMKYVFFHRDWFQSRSKSSNIKIDFLKILCSAMQHCTKVMQRRASLHVAFFFWERKCVGYAVISRDNGPTHPTSEYTRWQYLLAWFCLHNSAHTQECASILLLSVCRLILPCTSSALALVPTEAGVLGDAAARVPARGLTLHKGGPVGSCRHPAVLSSAAMACTYLCGVQCERWAALLAPLRTYVSLPSLSTTPIWFVFDDD